MNITVRTGGVMNNTLTRAEFLVIVEQIFGEGKTIDEYIALYNDAPRAQQATITVHHEVPTDVAELGAIEKAQKTIEAPAEATPEDYLDAATTILSAAVGSEVTIEFASDEDDAK